MGPELIKKDMKVQKDKSRAKLLEEKGPEVILAEQNNQKRRSMNKLRVELGPKQIRKQQNLWENKSRKRKRLAKPEHIKNDESKRKKLSWNIQREKNPDKAKENQHK